MPENTDSLIEQHPGKVCWLQGFWETPGCPVAPPRPQRLKVENSALHVEVLGLHGSLPLHSESRLGLCFGWVLLWRLGKINKQRVGRRWYLSATFGLEPKAEFIKFDYLLVGVKVSSLYSELADFVGVSNLEGRFDLPPTALTTWQPLFQALKACVCAC